MITCDPNGRHVLLKSSPRSKAARCELVLETSRKKTRFEGTPGADGVCRGKAAGWKVSVEPGLNAAGLDRLRITVSGRAKSRLKRLVLRIPTGGPDIPATADGATSVFAVPDGLGLSGGFLPAGRGKSRQSSMGMILVSSRTKEGFLACIDQPAGDFSTFVTSGSMLEAGFEIDRPVEADATYDLVFAWDRDPSALLETMRATFAAHARPTPPPMTGWNSWDYYGGAITMDDVRQEMKAINASPLAGKVRSVVLDMGWEKCWGDWRMNRDFPASYKAVASEIREAGFVPGIWVAPLHCYQYSHLGRHRQDLLLRTKAGHPIFTAKGGLFDFSMPEVRDQLQDWFGAMRKAGFEVFKLDYMYRGYLDATAMWSDMGLGRAALVRSGMEAVREAVGEGAHILNCGAPAESMLGIADSSRLSQDIHTFWSHVPKCASQIASRMWQTGSMWRGDPDFTVIRSDATSDDVWRNSLYTRKPVRKTGVVWQSGAEASFEELKVWVTVVRLTGGNVFLSDSIARLNPSGIDTLTRLFPPLDQPGIPADLFVTHEKPRYWLAPQGRGHLLGVFNWEDTPAPVRPPRGVDLPEKGKDQWTGRTVNLSSREMVPPRSALLLEC